MPPRYYVDVLSGVRAARPFIQLAEGEMSAPRMSTSHQLLGRRVSGGLFTGKLRRQSCIPARTCFVAVFCGAV